ncbi:MAG: hypothetical protein QXG18_01075 [Candidatus Pacearchaeota archaeon]
MKKTKIFFILLVFCFYYTSALTYKEINKQIEDKIKFEIFEDNFLIKEGNFDMVSSKEGFFFLKKIKFNKDYEKAEISFILDKGYFLSEFGISPSNYEISTDGYLIKVKWFFEDIKEGEEKTLFAISEKTKENKIYLNIFILTFLIIFLSIITYFYFFYKNRKKENERFLLDDERKILNYLRRSERKEAWQKNIQKDLSFSKAKLSRLIRNLESRGLIKKIPFGNTNKIVLK